MWNGSARRERTQKAGKLGHILMNGMPRFDPLRTLATSLIIGPTLLQILRICPCRSPVALS